MINKDKGVLQDEGGRTRTPWESVVLHSFIFRSIFLYNSLWASTKPAILSRTSVLLHRPHLGFNHPSSYGFSDGVAFATKDWFFSLSLVLRLGLGGQFRFALAPL